jgi:hypothetical protein
MHTPDALIQLLAQLGTVALIIVGFGSFFGLVTLVAEAFMAINDWYEERKYKKLRSKRYLRFNHKHPRYWE